MAARAKKTDQVVRAEKLGLLGRMQEIIEEAFYQVREEYCNNADTDPDLDWMDAKIESALEKLKTDVEEQLADIVDEVQDER